MMHHFKYTIPKLKTVQKVPIRSEFHVNAILTRFEKKSLSKSKYVNAILNHLTRFFISLRHFLQITLTRKLVKTNHVKLNAPLYV